MASDEGSTAGAPDRLPGNKRTAAKNRQVKDLKGSLRERSRRSRPGKMLSLRRVQGGGCNPAVPAGLVAAVPGLGRSCRLLAGREVVGSTRWAVTLGVTLPALAPLPHSCALQALPAPQDHLPSLWPRFLMKYVKLQDFSCLSVKIKWSLSSDS